jgi:hypothetical protein
MHMIRKIGLAACWLPTIALSAGIAIQPASIETDKQPGYQPYDTVMVLNLSTTPLRVDSITLRFLNGGPNPNPNDFIACKTCPHDTLSHYVYGGWTYGSMEAISLRYVQDSLFLLQDQKGKPVSLELQALDSIAFPLEFPINCPVCGRLPSYPGATQYRFTFYSSDGSALALEVKLGSTTGMAVLRSRVHQAPNSMKIDPLGRKPSYRLAPNSPANSAGYSLYLQAPMPK